MAVLKELRRLKPRVDLRFWCDIGFLSRAKKVVQGFDDRMKVHFVLSGKFRRYNHIPFWRQLLMPSIVVPNLFDLFLIVAGFFQSFIKLVLWRPDVIFTKGGFVCLPVGLAAFILRIPLVTHDSDAHPGLTNRILSKWATAIATGAPLEYYNYPKDKVSYIGIPISSSFHRFSKKEKVLARRKWGIDEVKPLIVVTGGGLGAKRLNDTIAKIAKKLLKSASIVLISGDDQYEELNRTGLGELKDFHLFPFIANDIASLLGSADVVVARAGATTILELAALAKPTILVPNLALTGGHQLKNAQVYADKGAVIVFDEDTMVDYPNLLTLEINALLSKPDLCKKMSDAFYSFSKPDASLDMANIIIKSAKRAKSK